MIRSSARLSLAAVIVPVLVAILAGQRSASDADLNAALERLGRYVLGYQEQYSALVAEELYVQRGLRRTVTLRSDFLLVKPSELDGWVSFRDVFEVDGRPVRDRDDRLKRLFLQPTPDAADRLRAIKNESARYNIGAVLRNINVPLFPLIFPQPEYRGRFRFRLGRTEQRDGTTAVQIDFEETARPTVTRDEAGRDVPVSGWYLVDRATGAVLETKLQMRSQAARGSIRVRYRHDDALGLWVPAQMREDYVALSVPVRGRADGIGTFRDVQTIGEARYSNVRRFRVTTDEKIAIPK